MSYLITIVINNIQKNFTSNSLRYDGEYYFIPREYLGLKSDLKLPLFLENENWYIRSINNNIYDMMNNIDDNIDPISNANDFLEKNIINQKNVSLIAMIDKKIIKEKKICNNDLFVVFDRYSNLHYSVTFKECNNVDLRAKLFKIKQDVIFVGKKQSCDICYNFNNLILEEHFCIEIKNNGMARIHSCDKGNQYISSIFYVNGKSSFDSIIKFGDIINLRDLTIIYLDKCLGIYATNVQISNNSLQYITNISDTGLNFYADCEMGDKKTNFISRIPRKANKINDEKIEIELPPQPTLTKKMPAILSIGPSLTMSMAMLVSVGVSVSNVLQGGSKSSLITSVALAISMLLGALLWPLLTRAYQKKQDRLLEEHRHKKYSEYLVVKEDEINTKTNKNLNILNNELFLSPQEILNLFSDKYKIQQYLYQKQVNDDDFLKLRIGKGQVENDLNICISPKKFSLYDDLLRENAYKLYNKYSFIKNTPVIVSLLNNKTVGITGNQNNNIFRTLLMSLTYCHAYDEVKTVFIFNDFSKTEFEWVKNIPHTISDLGDEKYIATNKSEVHQLFTIFNEFCDLRESNTSSKIPHYIIFIFDIYLIENESFINRIIKSNINFGFTFVYITSEEEVPKECDIVIDLDKDGNFIYSKREQNKKYFIPDIVREEDWKKYFEKLNQYKLKLSSNISTIPEKLSFLDMYQVGNVQQLNISKRWKINLPYKSMNAPVGVKAGGEVFSLDMHESYHGPHGLAAGMTGSGKSEFLQTLILSLSINYSPDDISFVIIDFKGGGMANSFKDLPHLAGTMTNLSGNELKRAMITIQSETERRQKKFKLFSVNHIDKYQKMYAENKDKMDPLPHLIIIVDEFAELKSQQPEFMKQLIELARIGRSLGIHLLLATQKPAGVVDDQIWGNSRFRVCLKVLEKQDSNEMIRRPDAALIKLPGRCYLQVGYDEVFEYFQSGYSGVPYIHQDKHHDINEDILELVDSCGNSLSQISIKLEEGNKDYTQLNAIVDEIKKVAVVEGYSRHRLWLNPLPKNISLDKLMLKCYPCFDNDGWKENSGYSAVIGMIDDPATQRQISFSIDFSKGNYGIYGVTGCGKSNVLQSLIYSSCNKYSPMKIKFEILDFSSRILGAFNNMPHINNIANSDDEIKVREIIESLLTEIEFRNKKFGEKGVSSLDAFNSNSKIKLPMIVFVIDNYSVISERYNNYIDKIVKIVRSGFTYGICTIITSTSRNTLYSRIADCLTNSLAMKMNDKLSYREIIRTSNIIDIDDYPGRGITLFEKRALEFQTALVGGISDDANRTKHIKNVSFEMSEIAFKQKLISNIKDEAKFSEMNLSNYFDSPILLEEANENLSPCVIRSINENYTKKDSELLLGSLNEKQYLLSLDELKTLFVFGDDPNKNAIVVDNILKQCISIKKNIYLFDSNNKFKSFKGVKIYNFVEKTVSEGIAEVFTKIKSADASDVIIVIDDLPKFFNLLDEVSGSRLGALIGAGNNKRALFIISGSVREIGKLTSCEIGSNLRHDKNARGIYINKFYDEDIIFGDLKNLSNFKKINLSDKQGFIVGKSYVLCDLEGLK